MGRGSKCEMEMFQKKPNQKNIDTTPWPMKIGVIRPALILTAL